MASKLATVLDAIEATIAPLHDPPTLWVERNRDSPVDRFPTIVMQDSSDEGGVTYTLTHQERWAELTCVVDLYVGDVPDLRGALDDLFVEVTAALLADTRLGGEVTRLELVSFESDVSQQAYSGPAFAGEITLRAKYQTDFNVV